MESERSFQISYSSPPNGPLHHQATTPGAVAAFHDPALPKSALVGADTSTCAPSSACSSIDMDAHVKQLEKWKRANDERLWKEQQQQIQNATTEYHQQQHQRKVQFADTALLYSSERSFEDDVLPAWYTRDELNTFKQQRKEIVQTLKRFQFDLIAVERRYCLRGYEPYFSLQVNKAMKYARSLVQSLVFTEQERQWKHGISDVEAIRESSCCASQWARDNALQLGKNDEVEVFGDYAAMLEEAEAAAQAKEASRMQAEEEALYYEDPASYYMQSSQPQPMVTSSVYEQRKRKGSSNSQADTSRKHPQQSSSSVDDELESARRLYQQLRLPPR